MTGQAATTATRQAAGPVTRTECCIAGGGPAGVMLGFLLARQGVDVVVLEKHGDFLRDFRGDTIHPSTLRILDELGLADDLLRLPHDEAPLLQASTPQGTITVADFRSMHTSWPYLVFLPQWDFLNFIATRAQTLPQFHLRMQADVKEIIEEGSFVRGVRYQGPDGWQEVRAPLTVAADGRSSVVRQQAGMEPAGAAPPMDVLWFRLSRRPNDPAATAFRVRPGHFLLFINRRDYWQVAYVIPKGTDQQVRAAGLPAFQQSLRELAPEFADRADELCDWDQIKLLSVQTNRLRRWYRPGLLCIGDAAHAMSPIGGVGINLAIQDAVVAANVLGAAYRAGPLRLGHLAAVQWRRTWPTRVIQGMQIILQQRLAAPALAGQMLPTSVPLVRLPVLRALFPRLIARLIAFGVWPVHVQGRRMWQVARPRSGCAGLRLDADWFAYRVLPGGRTLPISKSIARFNRRFTNRLTSKFAGYLPGFAIVTHVGRKSGRTYRTPINAFRMNDGYLVALTYGADSDWVKNVLAAGSCELQTRGRRVRLVKPRLITDRRKAWAPLPVRFILDRTHVSECLRLSFAERASPGSA